MGNSHSHHKAPPPSMADRSVSWQPDATFHSIQHPPFPPYHPPTPGSPQFPGTLPGLNGPAFPGPPGPNPADAKFNGHSSASIISGSHGNTQNNNNKNNKGSYSGPKSRPGTNDSGYFTPTGHFTDSDKGSAKNNRGSKIFMGEGPQTETLPRSPGFLPNGAPRPMTPHGPQGPPPPNSPFGPQQYPPPNMFFPPPGMAGPPPPWVVFPQLPPEELKKHNKKMAKQNQKMLKQQQKNQKQFGVHGSFNNVFVPGPSFNPGGSTLGRPPPNGYGLQYRAHSIDNLHQPNFGMHPGMATMDSRRFASTHDLSHTGVNIAHLAEDPRKPPASDKEAPYAAEKRDKRRKWRKRKTNSRSRGSRGSLAERSSLSSSPEQKEDNFQKFQHERVDTTQADWLKSEPIEKPQEPETNIDELPRTEPVSKDIIYETLKRQNSNVIETRADICLQNHAMTAGTVPESSVQDKQPAEPSIKITPEAQAIMNRNAQLLGMQPLSNSEVQAQKTEPTPTAREVPKQNLSEVAKRNSDIEVNLVPTLPLRQQKKPQNFEPLDAWKSINVTAEVSRRNLHQEVVPIRDLAGEELIVPLIKPTPPPRNGATAEPIYLEYDERLPEFKKRLIETGSFDFPGKQSNSEEESVHLKSKKPAEQWSDAEKNGTPDETTNIPEPKRNWKALVMPDNNCYYPAYTEANKLQSDNNQETSDKGSKKSDKGSLRQIKHSFSNMFNRSKSSDRLSDKSRQSSKEDLKGIGADHPPGRSEDVTGAKKDRLKAQERSFAGDSSDIDFSWVQDLEDKFKSTQQAEEKIRTQRKEMFRATPINLNEYMAKDYGQNEPRINGSMNASFSEVQGTSTPLAERNNSRLATRKPNGSGDIPSAASKSFDDQPQMVKYFGIYDSRDGLTNRARSASQEPYVGPDLGTIVSENSVRSKAAQFEQNAHLIQNQMKLRDEQIKRQKSTSPVDRRPRAFPVPLRAAYEEPYIPKPDYDDDTPAKNNHFNNASAEHDLSAMSIGSYDRERSSFGGPESGRWSAAGSYQRGPDSPSVASRISGSRDPVGYSSSMRMLNGYVGRSPSRSPLPPDLSPTDPSALQAGRQYRSTEYYRNNVMSERQKQIERKAEKKRAERYLSAANPRYQSGPVDSSRDSNQRKLYPANPPVVHSNYKPAYNSSIR